MTRRKVIFPPPEFWTDPRSEPMPPLTATDYRRAAALLAHSHAHSKTGIGAIAQELATGADVRATARAATLILASLLTELRTEPGLTLAIEMLLEIADGDQFDRAPEQHRSQLRRAAAVALAELRDDTGEVDRLVSTPRKATQALAGLMLLTQITVPELDSPTGRHYLTEQAAHAAAGEADQ